MYHLQHKQLATTMENMQEINDMIGFLGHLCFLEHQCLLAKLEPSSGSHWKAWPLGTGSRGHSTLSKSLWPPRNRGSTRIHIHACYMQMRQQGMSGDRHIIQVPPITHVLYYPVGLYPQNTGSNIKALSSTGLFWAWSPMELPRWARPCIQPCFEVSYKWGISQQRGLQRKWQLASLPFFAFYLT